MKSSNYENLEFLDPKRAIGFHSVKSFFQQDFPSDQDSKQKRPEKKPQLEDRQAALFSLAWKEFHKAKKVKYSMVAEESNAADCILEITNEEGKKEYKEIQLKEVVPEEVNKKQTLQALLNKLVKKYFVSSELAIAINMNRDENTDLADISFPEANNITFWIYGLCGANRAFVLKNLSDRFQILEFDLPRMPQSISELQQ